MPSEHRKITQLHNKPLYWLAEMIFICRHIYKNYIFSLCCVCVLKKLSAPKFLLWYRYHQISKLTLYILSLRFIGHQSLFAGSNIRLSLPRRSHDYTSASRRVFSFLRRCDYFSAHAVLKELKFYTLLSPMLSCFTCRLVVSSFLSLSHIVPWQVDRQWWTRYILIASVCYLNLTHSELWLFSLSLHFGHLGFGLTRLLFDLWKAQFVFQPYFL